MSKRKAKQNDFIQKAFYQGGVEAMTKFILDNLVYPPGAAANKVEGTVHVQYHINHKGKVFKAKTLTNHGHGLEKEAIRLVKMLTFVVPKKTRNLRIIYNKTTHIHFRLPKPKPIVEVAEAVEPAPQKEQIVQYIIVPQKKAENKAVSKLNKNYTYTINIPKQ